MGMMQGRFKAIIRTLAAIGVMLWLTSPAFAASYVVITNKDVPVDSLSKAELRSIFLGEKVKWNHKKYIKIAILDSGDAYKDFLHEILGNTPAQYDNFWLKMVYTGKAPMPQSFSETGKLVDFVATHPGAVGFVAAGHAGDSVKTISIK